MTEDTILLDRYVTEGDRAALEELFARHYGAVHRTILHMVHNSFDADDLAQATFLQAVKKSDRFTGTGSFRGWLLAIAVNQVRDFRRGKKRKREDQLFDMFVATGEGGDVPETGMRREFEQKLEQALETLQPDLKDPLVLHYYEGLSFADVGAMLGVAKSTVQTRVQSSIRILRSEFTKRGWVALLPTFDQVLSSPGATVANTAAVQAGRRTAALFVVAAVVLTSITALFWWPEPDAPSPNTTPVADIETSETATATGSTNTAETQTNRTPVVQAPTEAMVHGRIVDAQSGKPIANAKARLYDYRDGSDQLQQTDDDGAFAFPVTVGRTDAFALILEGKRYARVIDSSAVSTKEPRTIRLESQQIIRGTVHDVDGNPVRNCRVSAIRIPGELPHELLLGAIPQRLRVDAWTKDSDGSGAFALTGLSKAPVVLVVEFKGEQPWLANGGDALVAGECGEQKIRLPHVGVIRVHVRDKLTGKPIADANISECLNTGSWIDRLPMPIQRTDKPGVFELRRWINRRVQTGMPGNRTIVRRAGMDSLFITATGYAPCLTSYERLQADNDYVYDLEKGATIHGQTVDDHGRPIPGSRVVVIVDDMARAMHITDEQGRFVASNLFCDYDIQVASYLPDHSARTSLAGFFLEPGQHRSLTLGGVGNGALIGSLKFRGEPVAGAIVDLSHKGQQRVQTVTDSSGRFRIDAQSPGPCTLKMWTDVPVGADAKKRIRVQRKLQLQLGRDCHVHIDVTHEVSGVCIDAATNKPAKGVSVQAEPIGNAELPIVRDTSKADGSFRMFLPAAGAYELRAEPTSAWYSRRNPAFEVQDGQPTAKQRLEVEKDPESAQFTIRVVDGQTGKPLAKGCFNMAGVSINADGRIINGEFDFDSLRAGHYEVRVHSNDHVDQTFGVDVAPGEKLAPAKIVMQRASSLGFVQPDTDKPPHPAGMIDGDVIVSWGSHKIVTMGDLVVAMTEIGEEMAPMTVIRDGERLQLDVSKRLIPEAHFDFGWPHDFDMALRNR